MFSILNESIINEKEIRFNYSLNQNFFNNPTRSIEKVLLLIPDFAHFTNGAPNTLFRFAHFLANKGIKVTLAISDATIHKTIPDFAKTIRGAFGNNSNIEFLVTNSAGEKFNQQLLPDSDICIATLWTTAYYLLGYTRTKGKFYFIQDFESLFYPAGWEYSLADLSYDLGYVGIFNTPGVMRAIQKNHNISGTSFIPGVDQSVFFSSGSNTVHKSNETIKIIFYGRPPVPRNMYELGKTALRFVKAKYGKRVQILIAGWEEQTEKHTPYNFKHEWLGYMPYEKTGDVYRESHIGLALMATPHPSYLPPQFMACGVVPVVTKNSGNEWLLKHEFNCLSCYPTAHNLAAGISQLIEDPVFRMRLQQNAIHHTQKFHWEQTFQQIYDFIVFGKLI